MPIGTATASSIAVWLTTTMGSWPSSPEPATPAPTSSPRSNEETRCAIRPSVPARHCRPADVRDRGRGHGRQRQRPATLRPSPGERSADVLDDWEAAAGELDREWSAIDDDRWSSDVVEPADTADLGTVPLARLALARLTE